MDHIKMLSYILPNQKWFDFYSAIWKILHRMWAALCNIPSVSLERSCSEQCRE
jgi:hypothetical protein